MRLLIQAMLCLTAIARAEEKADLPVVDISG